jgi:hypothetical protein
MAMNPMQLLQLSERLKIFREQHPRVLEFLHAVARDNIQPGVIMELKVTDNEGRTKVTNIMLTPEDVETIGIIKNLKGES